MPVLYQAANSPLGATQKPMRNVISIKNKYREGREEMHMTWK